jgi:hypothetical protein
MNANRVIRSINFNGGEVLTLEKMPDRMEFEAFSIMTERLNECTCYVGSYTSLPCIDCPNLTINPCSCDGPVGYINCHPYK